MIPYTALELNSNAVPPLSRWTTITNSRSCKITIGVSIMLAIWSLLFFALSGFHHMSTVKALSWATAALVCCITLSLGIISYDPADTSKFHLIAMLYTPCYIVSIAIIVINRHFHNINNIPDVIVWLEMFTATVLSGFIVVIYTTVTMWLKACISYINSQLYAAQVVPVHDDQPAEAL